MSDLRKAITYAYDHDLAATCVVLAEQWLIDHSDDIWVTHAYAEMLYTMTRYDEAIIVYKQAIDRFPEQRWAMYNQLGHLHRYRGDYARAEQCFRKASEEDPSEAASFIFMGSVQARQGKLQQAEQSHRKATNCPEGCIDEAYHNLGLILRAQGRLREAADCFRRAIELDPEYNNAKEALDDVTRAAKLLGNGAS